MNPAVEIFIYIFIGIFGFVFFFKFLNTKMKNDLKYKSENPESEKKQEKLNLEVLYCDRCLRRAEHKRVYTGEKRYGKEAFRVYCGNCGRESITPLLESFTVYEDMKLRRSHKPVIKFSKENIRNYANRSAKEKFNDLKNRFND